MERVTIVDQNEKRFGTISVEEGIETASNYAKPGDRFRVYVVDEYNPSPGYIAAWVSYGEIDMVDESRWIRTEEGDITVLRRNN